MANELCWKYGDKKWSSSKNTGRVVLAIITDYIERNPGKDFDALSKEFSPMGDADTKKLIDELEKVKKRENNIYFYCNEKDVISRKGKKIVVNNFFSTKHQGRRAHWKKFNEFIKELDSSYMIKGDIEEDMGFADHIQSEHVISAFDYIGEKGKKGNYDIQYLLHTSIFMGVSHKGHNNWFAIKDALRVAHLYAINEQLSEKDGNFAKGQIKMLDDTTRTPFTSEMAEARFKELKFEVKRLSKGEEPMLKNKVFKALKKFNQIILFGPPGTGKTFSAKEAVKELLSIEIDKKLPKDSEYWDIVQFHPSYNYEDFVRGVQVKITENGQVNYETINKIFGVMCERAYNDSQNDYALIIDEINRTNVSAVLGELIYALEYRDEEIKTLYKVKDKQGLTIPKNLYIIGTMNTADRTIGQIDYAVRRRFAFVKCLPEESVIKDKIALGFFERVENIFNKDNDNYISPDFDEDDVRIGHSYFITKDKEQPILKILYQIFYQVIPILREYVKDGVLTELATGVINKIAKDVEEKIDKIETDAKKLLADESKETDLSADDEDKKKYEGNFIFFWKTTEKTGFNLMGVTALNIIKHYVKHHKPENLKALLEGLFLPSNAVIIEPEVINKNAYFPQKENKISLADGSRNIVSFVWPNKPTNSKWKSFVNKAKDIGYKITPCHFVNIGQDPRRNWQDCAKYGFVAAGGDKGERHAKAMGKLKKGSPVFAFLGGDGVSNSKKGFVAWGWVINEAVPIREFKFEDGKLLSECESVYSENNGRNYKEQYAESFDNKLCDYAVGIKWVKVLSEEDTVKLTWNANVVRERINGFEKLQKAFNLVGKESE